LRIDAMQLRGRLALASAVGGNRSARLKIAARMADKIASENMSYASPFANLIRAGIAHQQGDDDAAVTLLEKASNEFAAADMTLYAIVTSRRLGEMMGGDRGRELRAEAAEWMARQMIKNPEKVMNLMAPGFS
jgi:eukaryotic-like serine/threonine-protein kinase